MASLPSPFYRNRQSNKALDPNGPTAKFLYTILKQLDLKNIDWNEVASGLDITNGHAARMRWSRFRAQIEGLDNSYSRQSGKKRDGEKKRKKEKPGDSASVKEIINQKRVKTELVSDLREDTTSQLNLYADVGIPTTIKSEQSEKTSTVNGITVHHPKMTTIEVTQPGHKVPMIKQDPFTVSSASVAANRGVSKPVASAPPATQTHHSYSAEPALQWSQQLPSSNYMYQYPTTTNPWYYQPALPDYASGYQYPSMYAGQNGQQQFMYGRSQLRIPNSQLNYYSYNSLSSSTPTTVPDLHDIFAPSPKTTSLTTRQSIVPGVPPTKHSVSAHKDDQPQTTTQICELAAEASYPWPYSEASLADFSRKGCPGQDVAIEKDSNPIDTSDIDAEHVIELDADVNAQQSEPSTSNAGGVVGICQITRNENTITGEPAQQAKESDVLDRSAPQSTACPPGWPLNTIKTEPELL